MVYTKIEWQDGQSPDLDADNLNHKDKGVFNAYHQSQAFFLEDDAELQLSYDGEGNLEKIEEYINNTKHRETSLSYNGDGNLETVQVETWNTGGTKISDYTDTLSYDADDNLEKVERSVTV